MNKKISYILGLMVLVFGVGAYAFAGDGVMDRISAVTSAPPAQTEPVTKDAPAQNQEQVQQQPVQYHCINPLIIVKSPNNFLNKKVCMKAKFGKFATLGLDYKPAMRSSETHISFLIYRPDAENNIPLSEMKLFVTRKAAEKLIDLKEGDMILFTGTVFSTALGDPWIDVDSITKLNKETPKKASQDVK